MNYHECLAYLDRLGNEVLTMKFGLDAIRRLLSELGDPHLVHPSVLVAGTNAKGSVARFLGGILSAAGLRTGLYTSPHLIDVQERIAVDGSPIPADRFAAVFSEVVAAIAGMDLEFHPTYFETLTATAFLEFAQSRVEVAVLEIGMGGRLDSTNVVDPRVSVITPIGLDHQHVLGDTIAKIAAEKAGIIHRGRPVVMAGQDPVAAKVVRERARELGCQVTEVDRSELVSSPDEDGCHRIQYRGVQARLRVAGAHQAENAALAVLAAESLRLQGFPLPVEAIVAGLEGTPPYAAARKVATAPDLFIDGGHNPDAARSLARFLYRHTRPPRALVLGMMRDKQIGEFLTILRPCFDAIYLTRVDSPRAASLQELAGWEPSGIPCASPLEAVRRARSGGNTVVVTGSFYLAGEVARAFTRQDR